ncbi:PREDICTED: tumor necrosis factor ligand superfamily member 4 isoform X2 [Cercocebus atys]|nr:PREDICTED: tumor necrosis factor ligand superfamily member 4 isoform X2 [Cercocebus atys]XP_011941306.1 PREDICTED: tumor necrosis factor ligand superfamily member 4 isoform X2 [Cercocebus atys]XP_011941307.1 PREDICTED: tumor necrosis factor ligand superfamily member 4 isoform X2 [Cercocebus atys]XP_011941308.1 PREDICTED: tumor necrosis factor ligand superfamily member 4 isoform X2 [Cercocebus atys]XP_011941309.1 PREDICTED: tumor necrosis factor ligand superfamily member 4 isoform X2 [Cercoce
MTNERALRCWWNFHIWHCCATQQDLTLIVKMERVQPLEENVGNAARPRFERNKLLLVASVIQGLGLLLCFIYICLHFSALQVPHQYPRIQSIKVQFTEYKKEEGFILTSQKEDEIMKVQNNSVIINCDGFYLISLKGYFSQEVNISLHYQKDEEPLFQLKKVRSVNSLMVASLTYKDKVYLNVTTDNTSLDDFHVNGGELILIHQNPGEFCVL